MSRCTWLALVPRMPSHMNQLTSGWAFSRQGFTFSSLQAVTHQSGYHAGCLARPSNYFFQHSFQFLIDVQNGTIAFLVAELESWRSWFCGSLVHNGTWFYGTYYLDNPNATVGPNSVGPTPGPNCGNWCVQGPVGHHTVGNPQRLVSRDHGHGRSM